MEPESLNEMSSEPTETYRLLERWHGGDQEALAALLERDLSWIERRVRRRLGPRLRSQGETIDFVQDTMVKILRYGPRFVLSDQAQFRGLLSRIIENVLRDQHDRYSAQKRNVDNEKALPPEELLNLDDPDRAVTTPSRAFERQEDGEWLRLAIELLRPAERKVIYLRQWSELQFSEIGEQLDISEDAARLRYHRALKALQTKMRSLRSGDLDEVLVEVDD